MSANPERSNGIDTGNLIQAILGDQVDKFANMDSMKDIFYWRTIELTTEEIININENLGDIEMIVYLDSFTSEDYEKLNTRGPITEKLGGDITYSNFKYRAV